MGAALFAHLAADSSWDVLRLSDVPERGAAFALLEEAKAHGMPVGTWASVCSPYVLLPGSYEELQARLPTKLKGPSLNAKDGQIAIEELQLVYSSLTLTPAS